MFVLSSSWISTCSLILPTPISPPCISYFWIQVHQSSYSCPKLGDSLYPWHFSISISSLQYGQFYLKLYSPMYPLLSTYLTTSKFLTIFDQNDQSSLLNSVSVLLFPSSNLFSFLLHPYVCASFHSSSIKVSV